MKRLLIVAMTLAAIDAATPREFTGGIFTNR